MTLTADKDRHYNAMNGKEKDITQEGKTMDDPVVAAIFYLHHHHFQHKLPSHPIPSLPFHLAITGLVKFVNRNARGNKAGVYQQLITCVSERRSTTPGIRQKISSRYMTSRLQQSFPIMGRLVAPFGERNWIYFLAIQLREDCEGIS